MTLLLIDDLGLTPMNDYERRDLLKSWSTWLSSTIVTSQLSIKSWHDIVGDPTIADVIHNRLVNNTHKFKLKGGAMRKKHGNLTKKQTSDK